MLATGSRPWATDGRGSGAPEAPRAVPCAGAPPGALDLAQRSPHSGATRQPVTPRSFPEGPVGGWNAAPALQETAYGARPLARYGPFRSEPASGSLWRAVYGVGPLASPLALTHGPRAGTTGPRAAHARTDARLWRQVSPRRRGEGLWKSTCRYGKTVSL